MIGIKLTPEEIISRARVIHGDRYDYSETVYDGMSKPITYRCLKHGLITQRAFNHIISKNGCPHCARESRFQPKTTKSDFIANATLVHGDRYDYSKVDYQGVDKKVCIICKKHGEFWQTPWNHIKLHNGCPKCAKNRRLTLDIFLERAQKAHGDKYDYSSVEITSAKANVRIKCPIHGFFNQRASQHINGSGCPKCSHRENDGFVHGKAIKPANISSKGINKRPYMMWVNMLERTTPGSIFQQRFPTYIGCACSDEWLSFENFLDWYKENGGFDNPEYVLDKDILIKGNKLYSRDTCCLVPPEINRLIVVTKSKRGECPLGVCRAKDKYKAQIVENGKKIWLGTYNTKEEAFDVYLYHKKAEIRRVADKYYIHKLISKRVHDALINYTFDFND